MSGESDMARTSEAYREDPRERFETDMTLRDLIWDAALECAQDCALWFQQWRVREKAMLGEEHRRTVTRTLRCMEELGWLEREEDRPKQWRPGPKARARFQRRDEDG